MYKEEEEVDESLEENEDNFDSEEDLEKIR